MAEHREIALKWECPVCFLKGNDSAHLLYDTKRERFYCVRCCFSGTVKEIKESYEDYQKRFRLMGVYLNLLKKDDKQQK